MATIFLEPGGDADFGTGLWPNASGSPAIATDFVHGSHIKSIKYPPGGFNYLLGSGMVTDAGGRVSIWIYLNALSTSTNPLFQIEQSNDGNVVAGVQITSTGILRLRDFVGTQLGSDGQQLATGQWYRLCFAWKITSSTVNEFRLFVNGSLSITATNATINQTTSADLQVGNGNADTTLDFRSSDHYIDNSNALTDPGNIWVTAKRPFANGTSVQFTTQIGAGGSGYGSGHTPQVNERPNSDTNGWSIQNAAKQTEEYSIENQSTGDINITGATIVDFMGWVRAKVGVNSTGNIILGGTATNISITTAAAFFTKIAGSTTYPAGNTDIGMDTNTVNQLFSLYECGVIIAYIPTVVKARYKTLLGVGL